ncbi:MAG: hypothetical protein ACLUEQ_08425 [Cloacibacillus evryensis]
MLWEVDLRTREMKFSGFGADEVGYSGRVFKDVPESLLAEGHIRDDYKDEFRRMFADIYAGRDGGEYYLMSKDAGGEYVPVRASFRLLRDEGGGPYYVIGVREPRIVLAGAVVIPHDDLRRRLPSMLTTTSRRFTAMTAITRSTATRAKAWRRFWTINAGASYIRATVNWRMRL